MTSTNVQASTGEITQAEVQEGAAAMSDNFETTAQKTPAEEQELRDCLDILFRITEHGKRIGGGAQAVIREGSYEGRPLVLKVYEDPSTVPKWEDKIFNIIAPHVCSSVGYTKVHDGKGSVASIMPRHLYDLRKLINKRRKTRSSGQPFSYVAAVDLIVQIAIGMSNLHKRDIMHRDIRAENILVTHITPNEKLVCVAIADFDGCKNVVGTGFWRAPEVLEAINRSERSQNIQFTCACDVYSFAITCYEILTGELPFANELKSDYQIVLSGKRPELPADLPEEMAMLINNCWHQDPRERPDSNKILQTLRKMIRERTELNPLQTKFDLVDSWCDEDKSEQPSQEELLQSLKDELEVLKQQNEIQAERIGLEVIEIYEEYKTKFGLVSVWHVRQFWTKLEVALRMINKGNEFINSLPDHGSNTVKVLAIWSRLVKPLVAVQGIGSVFQAFVRTYATHIRIPVENLSKLISVQLRDYLNSFRASRLACQLRFARTSITRAVRKYFRIRSH